jgi:hypothetical protein
MLRRKEKTKEEKEMKEMCCMAHFVLFLSTKLTGRNNDC